MEARPTNAELPRRGPEALPARLQLVSLLTVVGWLGLSYALDLPLVLDGVVLGVFSLLMGIFQGKRRGWW